MEQASDTEPQQVGTPEELAERAVHAAEEIAEVLRQVDENTRYDLLHVVADELNQEGVHVVDAHGYIAYVKAMPEFDPDSRPGDIGKRTGRTRAQVLADIALIGRLRPRRRKG